MDPSAARRTSIEESIMSSHALPTPERLIHAINAYQLSAALKAALQLHLFTAFKGEPRNAASL